MTAFRRYTNLAAAIHLLRTQTITLLDPSTWDDKNDAFFMAEYKRITGARTVLALCFAEHVETYHHWRVFSYGNDGVCIEFDKDQLLSTFEKDRLIRKEYVEYKTLREAAAMKSVNVEKLPFLKRSPYKDEREYRVIYVNKRNIAQYQNYLLNVDWIKRITLSPWLSVGLAASVKNTLQSIPGCAGLEIARSTLVNNDAWKQITKRVR